jgi:SNF2 family DNA or RNA helicase
MGTRRTTLSDPRAHTAHPDEQAAIERLLKAGFSAPNRDGQFVLKGESQVLAFFATELPRLEQMWTVSIGARFEHVTRDIERVRPRFEIKSSGENWFDLSAELATASGERFSAAEIQRLLQSGQRSVRLKNKKLAIFDTPLLDEFQELLRDCDPRQLQPGLYRMNAQHAPYVAEFASGQGNSLEAPPTWSRWIAASAEISKAPAVPLGDLENVLRGYQVTGVNWLNFLKINNWSGLLADEMGLGKTIQILAFLRAFRGISLVVCPSSLVFNWQREAARFASDLQTVAVVGSDRVAALRRAADLYITSYPLLRRDAALYREMQFETVILDEAQHIKNPDSQNAQAATALRARHRFALTGTPIENSVAISGR